MDFLGGGFNFVGELLETFGDVAGGIEDQLGLGALEGVFVGLPGDHFGQALKGVLNVEVGEVFDDVLEDVVFTSAGVADASGAEDKEFGHGVVGGFEGFLAQGGPMVGEVVGLPEGGVEHGVDARPMEGTGFEELSGDGIKPAVEFFIFVERAEVGAGFVRFDLEGFFVIARFFEGFEHASEVDSADIDGGHESDEDADGEGAIVSGDRKGGVSHNTGEEGGADEHGHHPGSHCAFDPFLNGVGAMGIEVLGEVGVFPLKLTRGHGGLPL